MVSEPLGVGRITNARTGEEVGTAIHERADDGQIVVRIVWDEPSDATSPAPDGG